MRKSLIPMLIYLKEAYDSEWRKVIELFITNRKKLIKCGEER